MLRFAPSIKPMLCVGIFTKAAIREGERGRRDGGHIRSTPDSTTFLGEADAN